MFGSSVYQMRLVLIVSDVTMESEKLHKAKFDYGFSLISDTILIKLTWLVRLSDSNFVQLSV